jgi:hypothetical protein
MPLQQSFVLCFNPSPPGIAPGEQALIGWQATALGNAILVSLAGVPVVLAVNLDLADDEVAIGGPDAAGTRRLFRGRNNGDGTNTIEAVVQPATTGNVGQVAITAADTAVVAASATRRAILVWNIGTRDVDIFLAAVAGAFGVGARLPTPVAGAPVVFRFAYNGAVRAIRGAAGVNGRLSFAEELD